METDSYITLFVCLMILCVFATLSKCTIDSKKLDNAQTQNMIEAKCYEGYKRGSATMHWICPLDPQYESSGG